METALTRALDDLKAQRDQLREQLALADQAVESLERFVKAQRGVVKIDTPRRSPRHPHSGNGVPSGPEGIRLVLADHPGECLSVRQITDELTKRGWIGEAKDPVNATSSNALVALRNYPGQITREREKGTTAYLYCYGRDARREVPGGSPPAGLDTSVRPLESIAATAEELAQHAGGG